MQAGNDFALRSHHQRRDHLRVMTRAAVRESADRIRRPREVPRFLQIARGLLAGTIVPMGIATVYELTGVLAYQSPIACERQAA